MAGEHQDWGADAPSPDPLADIDAVEVREIPVKDDQIRCGFAATADQARRPIGSDVNVVALDIEFEAEQLGQPRLIIDDQNATSLRGLLRHQGKEPLFNLDNPGCTAAGITKIASMVFGDGFPAVMDRGFDSSTA